MRRRRVWTGLILGLLAACLLWGTAVAASGGTPVRAFPGTDITWELSGSTLTVKGTGAMPAFPQTAPSADTDPEMAQWFKDRSAASTVVFSDGITSIGEYAFYNCAQLNGITFPVEISTVGAHAFEGCTRLGKVELRNCLTKTLTISDSAFLGCTNLSSVVIPTNTQKIEPNAFRNTGLTSVLIPESVVGVGEGAFDECSKLAAIHYCGKSAAWGSYVPNTGTSLHFVKANVDDSQRTCSDTIPSRRILQVLDCANCNNPPARQEEILKNDPHTPEHLNEVEPTCTTGGNTEGDRCSKCGKNLDYIEFYDPLGHDLGDLENDPDPDNSQAPTCTEGGYQAMIRKCQRAGCTHTVSAGSEPLDPLKHTKPADTSMIQSAVETPATCSTPGIMTHTFICTTCKKQVTEEEEIQVDPDVHTPMKAEVETDDKPDCETAGVKITVIRCQECMKELDRDVENFDPLGHLKPDDPKKIQEIIHSLPGCGTPGQVEYRFICTREGCQSYESQTEVSESEDIPPTGEHKETVSQEKVEATCMSSGWTEGTKCSVCDHVLKEPEIIPRDPDAHAPGDPDDPDNPNNAAGGLEIEEEPPTCTDPGKKITIVRCSLCRKELSRTTEETDPATGHKASGDPVKEETTAPTCTEPGKKISTYLCETCGEEFTKEEKAGDPSGHKFGEWTVVLEPTATTPGMRGRECSVCHIQETEEIPATGKFTVTFNPNGGALPEGTPATAVTGSDGKLPGPLPTPTRAGGYTFEGWFTAAIDGNPVGDEPVFTGDITLYAHWSGGTETFTITFDPGEGTLAAESDKTAVTKPGGVLEALSGNPTRDGYAFDGWYTEKEGGSKISAGHVFSANATLYAHWTEKTAPDPSEGFTVTFDPNGGALADESAKTARTGKDGKLSALPAAPTRSGYTFDGWYTAASGGSAVTISTVFDQDTTVYAHWRSGSSGDTYLIRVDDTDFGSLTASASKAAEGEKITIYANPDSGYRLSSLRATDGSGKKLTLTRETDTRYTFIMPASLVNVTGSFIRDSSSGNVNDPSGGSWNTGAAWNPTDTATVPEPAPVVQSVPQITAYGQAFQDVPQGYWAAGEIAWAAQHGYMNGVGKGAFAPERLISHQQLWTVLVRLLSYSNVSDSNLQAVRAGLLDGGNPGAATTRQEMVTALYRCAFLLGGARSPSVSINTYPDSSQVSGYAQEAMAWAVTNGILTGNAQGRLNPNGTVSRAQFAVILYRFSQRYGR